jgi:c-di-GMP-binding flagellar brake protein YcgR
MTNLKRPLPVTLISILLVLTPFLNLYEYLFFGARTHWMLVSRSLDFSSIIGYLVIVSAVFSGIGIFKIKKWGWFLFHVFSVLIIALSVYRIQTVKNHYAYIMLMMNITIVITVFYFMSRSIRVPYFSDEFRGWRVDERLPLAFPVEVSTDKSLSKKISTATIDFSERGALIELDHTMLDHCLTSTLFIELKLGNAEPMKIESDVVYVKEIPSGKILAGLKFIHLRRRYRNEIKKFIHTRYTPRYACVFNVNVTDSHGRSIKAETVNLSWGGCYIKSTDHSFNAGDRVNCELYLHQTEKKKQVSFISEITWLNSKPMYGKPEGFGIKIKKFTAGRITYLLFLILNRKKYKTVRSVIV